MHLRAHIPSEHVYLTKSPGPGRAALCLKRQSEPWINLGSTAGARTSCCACATRRGRGRGRARARCRSSWSRSAHATSWTHARECNTRISTLFWLLSVLVSVRVRVCPLRAPGAWRSATHRPHWSRPRETEAARADLRYKATLAYGVRLQQAPSSKDMQRAVQQARAPTKEVPSLTAPPRTPARALPPLCNHIHVRGESSGNGRLALGVCSRGSA